MALYMPTQVDALCVCALQHGTSVVAVLVNILALVSIMLTFYTCK